MKDITLKIIGKMKYEGEEEDQIEFFTEGKLYERNGALYVVYEETELSGMEGSKTTLKLKEDFVRLRRTGQVGFESDLFFKEGERVTSFVNTPAGNIAVELVTTKLQYQIDQETKKGEIDIEYLLALNDWSKGKNTLKISIN